MPRKSASTAQLNNTCEPPVSKDKEIIDTPAQATTTKDKEKVRKNVEAAKPTEVKVKGKGIFEISTLTVEKKKSKQ